MIERRRAERPYCDRKILIGFDLSAEGVHIAIRDQGRGFDFSKYQNIEESESIARDVGRGLVLIQNFMDGVEFNESGNEIRMVCHRAAKAAAKA